ncbi:hypothetical protein BpHYR1_010581 [Brachionus plicatilis]|uniref:RNA-directed DNA polymerase from mobile element jockey-like n=1 Tax=Brachionus plicatilis TaxID=10195 RepID=A0A3M7QJT1_BRAPC|nr:hypothetical protein BpHYR1_010581 [Brachionus plicatilis]
MQYSKHLFLIFSNNFYFKPRFFCTSFLMGFRFNEQDNFRPTCSSYRGSTLFIRLVYNYAFTKKFGRGRSKIRPAIKTAMDRQFGPTGSQNRRVGNEDILVVKEICLLGFIIDQSLNFTKFVSNLSIQRIFYLVTSTFILPYFDYCSTLLCYFSKEAINKLAKRTTITLLNNWPNQKSGEITFEHFYSTLINCFVIKRSMLKFSTVNQSHEAWALAC